MELNLKDLAGDPSDETIGAAAVGLMAQAVLNKSKIETVMASLTQIFLSIIEMLKRLQLDLSAGL